jgi:hypothetical protein
MDCRVADADAPDLGVGTAGQQALGSSQRILCDLEGSGVHVECNDPPAVTGLDLRAHLLLVKGGAAAGMLFFAIPGMGSRHGRSPVRRDKNTVKGIVQQQTVD